MKGTNLIYILILKIEVNKYSARPKPTPKNLYPDRYRSSNYSTQVSHQVSHQAEKHDHVTVE